MVMSYANILDRIEQFLQDTSNTTYGVGELGMWIEEGLKEISEVVPHIIEVIFKIESRYGTDVTGTASSLTDLVKLQFVAGDATNEKVVHNTTDNTWAVVLVNSSTSVNTLSADIMDAGEQYEIYNKRCKNNKQIYIGDMPYFLRVSSVEYPLGQRRNFKVYHNEIIELDINSVNDSNSTLSPPRDVDVLVRFEVPHIVSQLTDLAGALSGGALAGATTVSATSLGSTEIIEVGEEFYVANQRSTYKITAEVTTSGNAATLTFYPPFESAGVDTDAVTFTKSTLSQDLENILVEMVCGMALMSESINNINNIVTGEAVSTKQFNMGERMYEKARLRLKRKVDPNLRAEGFYSRS